MMPDDIALDRWEDDGGAVVRQDDEWIEVARRHSLGDSCLTEMDVDVENWTDAMSFQKQKNDRYAGGYS